MTTSEDRPALSLFSPATQGWFQEAFAAPTPVQEEAWKTIAAGQHTLIVAPTGSGKTLSAFLWALDQLHRQPSQPGTQILYISPLKALGSDVERNLRAPLAGIGKTAQQLGLSSPAIQLGVRSGDTPPQERRQLLAKPPHILITTPESLFLMLTSKARSTLTQVKTVIIDEVHVLAGSKRGAHLAVSLERLDQLLESPAQRIALSATVEPVETVARFVGGIKPVEIVRPPAQKEWKMTLSVPVPDMTALAGPNALGEQDPPAPNPQGSGAYLKKLQERTQASIRAFETTTSSQQTFDDGVVGSDSLAEVPPAATAFDLAEELPANQSLAQALAQKLGLSSPTLGPSQQADPPQQAGSSLSSPGLAGGYQASIWPHVEERIVDLVEAHRSTLVFTNSRSLAEKITARLNEIYQGRLQARGQAEDPLACPQLARAHHGSVSKDQRKQIEEALKAGQLACVVATSSLELGIDMGHIDLVIQVEAPHSVAAGLQRIGRAGHQVGQVSTGYIYPKHRGDLLTATVTLQRMLQGAIEPLSIPSNPLDILAQQTLAACALGPIDVEAWFEALRSTAPFASLPRAAYEATLDLLAGKYPSEEFSELRPRLIWDRQEGSIQGRPGAQRLAVTSGGTIPDRGLFPVYLAGAAESKSPKRVGELDEEMVYESRAGDVIALGASSWRIEEISHDRVTVSPAPGQPGRLPFWHGDSPGRPLDLGQALGAFNRTLSQKLSKDRKAAEQELKDLGLDQWATDNLLAYLQEQLEAGGQVPSDRHLLLERFEDEVGDWRLVLHSPFGMPVHSPWALAVGQRAQERYGVRASAMAADDGIVLRLPATEAEPPGADLFIFDPADLEEIVTEEVGSSALFASRFRENAARALLLPRKDPGRRTPLWQQRQRSAQLLDVARKYPSFPLLLETARECLQDVYNLPGLLEIQRDIAAQKISLSELETDHPSPFARTLLYSYVSQFLYEGDAPLAERKAAALALDPELLSELLGKEQLRELLDSQVIRSAEARLQRTDPNWRLKGLEGAADLLRLLGPLSPEEAADRLYQPGQDNKDPISPQQAKDYLEELVSSRRALVFRLKGQEVYALLEDASRLRDALGVPLPSGLPSAFTQPQEHPLLDLIARYARTHAPFTAAQLAASLGLGVAVVQQALTALAADRRVLSGDFLPEELAAELSLARTGSSDPSYWQGTQWVHREVLKSLRARSLAALRAEVEPVAPSSYARFLGPWQHLESWQAQEITAAPGTFGSPQQDRTLKQDQSAMLQGYDGLLTLVDQLAGVRLPASALEPLILSSRLKDYSPALLDSAMSAGDILWSGSGQLNSKEGWICLHLAETAALTLADQAEREETLANLGPLEQRIYQLLQGGHFFQQIQAQLRAEGSQEEAEPSRLSQALWNLVWAGLVTGDTFAPVRALLQQGGNSHRTQAPRPQPRRAGLRRGAARLSSSRLGLASSSLSQLGEQVSPINQGRWSRLETDPLEPTLAAAARAELLVDRYGVLTRGAVAAEDTPGGFSSIYKVLAQAEEKGLARRGYFIEGLGAAQFSLPATIDRLRSLEEERERKISQSPSQESGQQGPYRPVRTRQFSLQLLAATDPANPYGSTLPWPEAHSWDPQQKTLKHRPGRKAGASLILADGEPVLYLERGGKTLLPFTDSPRLLDLAAQLIGQLISKGVADKILIETAGGLDILSKPDPSSYPQPPGPRTLKDGPLAEHPLAEDTLVEHPLAALRRSLLAAGFYASAQGLRMRKSY
ncbi:MAG: crosslink repair DNA glycosylase YcaQ family protein [Rothia sp. (in: high G+C Gram-positive bacteria)]|nr:crosslink repair DNA glycosylase YcaQ family protein [Rothia sp. (in: high G+C Gram-positive bacteria)]